MERSTITREELNQVTDKWLDEQDSENFQNPINLIKPKDCGIYDPQKEADEWASNLLVGKHTDNG